MSICATVPCTSLEVIYLCPISRTRTGYTFNYYDYKPYRKTTCTVSSTYSCGCLIDNVYFGHFVNFNLCRDITPFGTARTHTVVCRECHWNPKEMGRLYSQIKYKNFNRIPTRKRLHYITLLLYNNIYAFGWNAREIKTAVYCLSGCMAVSFCNSFKTFSDKIKSLEK